MTDNFCTDFWASLGCYFSLLGSLGSCVVVRVSSVSAMTQVIKVVTFSPLVPRRFRAKLAPTSQLKHLQQTSTMLTLTRPQCPYLFLGLWRQTKTNQQMHKKQAYSQCLIFLRGHKLLPDIFFPEYVALQYLPIVLIIYCYISILPQT